MLARAGWFAAWSTRTPCGVRSLRELLSQVAGYTHVIPHGVPASAALPDQAERFRRSRAEGESSWRERRGEHLRRLRRGCLKTGALTAPDPGWSTLREPKGVTRKPSGRSSPFSAGHMHVIGLSEKCWFAGAAATFCAGFGGYTLGVLSRSRGFARRSSRCGNDGRLLNAQSTRWLASVKVGIAAT